VSYFGCGVPVILRKVAEQYIFIIESYIHDLIKGETIEALERKEVNQQQLEIH
jgi:hypothetical protein